MNVGKASNNNNNNNNNNIGARSRGNDDNSMDFWSSVMGSEGSYEQQTLAERRQQQQETLTYSNITTKNDIFRGNLTISADISHIKIFNTERFCVDLAAAEPKAWKHVRGTQAVDAKFVELCFDNRDALQHILNNGLDTHRQHLNFTPDEPLVTTVSFWKIPIQLDKATVDEHIQRFGKIKSSYRARKNVSGNLIHTGVHVYTISL